MTKAALKAGVIGQPIDHSLSPYLHGFWLDEYAVDGEYSSFSIESKNLVAFLKGVVDQGWRGVNVTLPYKQSVLELVDQADDNALRIGAVNTVVVQEDGRLFGTNTDGFGFLENLKGHAPNWNASAGPAVVLGAGGAARAILVALQDSGAPEIRLLNRTKARAEKLAQELGGVIKVYEWENRAKFLAEAEILVNTTSLGMHGQAPLDIDLADLPVRALVNDIVYTPLETNFLISAKQRGNVIVGGLGMLLHQARPGFFSWFGINPKVTDALRKHVIMALKK